MHRRRSGLSQEDVSLLLGLVSAASVSRHERSRKVPCLKTALAYELICGVTVRALFLGEAHRLEREICKRAASLQYKWERLPRSRNIDRKIAALKRIVDRREDPLST
jgi:transcriptional regulator with XRE-family HTH domain